MSTAPEYEVTIDGGETIVGPVTLDQLRRGLTAGKVPADALARQRGSADWLSVAVVLASASTPERNDPSEESGNTPPQAPALLATNPAAAGLRRSVVGGAVLALVAIVAAVVVGTRSGQPEPKTADESREASDDSPTLAPSGLPGSASAAAASQPIAPPEPRRGLCPNIKSHVAKLKQHAADVAAIQGLLKAAGKKSGGGAGIFRVLADFEAKTKKQAAEVQLTIVSVERVAPEPLEAGVHEDLLFALGSTSAAFSAYSEMFRLANHGQLEVGMMGVGDLHESGLAGQLPKSVEAEAKFIEEACDTVLETSPPSAEDREEKKKSICKDKNRWSVFQSVKRMLDRPAQVGVVVQMSDPAAKALLSGWALAVSGEADRLEASATAVAEHAILTDEEATQKGLVADLRALAAQNRRWSKALDSYAGSAAPYVTLKASGDALGERLLERDSTRSSECLKSGRGAAAPQKRTPEPTPTETSGRHAQPLENCLPCSSQEDFDAVMKEGSKCCPVTACTSDSDCQGGRVCCKIPGGQLCGDASRCQAAYRVGR